ncbi:SAM-dependent methyltransferase [Mycobacteroides sp. LB1]|uniref:SAM-dependent methyltransferase n=1 Tax=Mycobacteroides sp. LB1 TaxID=2750814 RepID=UPI0015DED466|nr:SAM-dependent methyltransferase [Mycobacteroides sp. LB1]
MTSPAHKYQFDLIAAALRALESQRGHPLVHDPFAAVLVTAANEPLSGAFLAAGFPENPSAADGTFLLINASGIFTRHGDDFITTELGLGTRQVVQFAAGLDTRAYRLPWPTDAILYEVDHPHTLEFRGRILKEHGAVPCVTQRLVPIAASTDPWVEVLCDAGFDPEQPTAWLIAPLIMAGLPGTGQDLLFERIIELSAPGSAICSDANIFITSTETWDSIAEPVVPEDVRAANFWMLTYPDSRMPPADWLTEHGWITDVQTAAQIAAHYERPFTDDVPDIVKQHTQWQFLAAKLPS